MLTALRILLERTLVSTVVFFKLNLVERLKSFEKAHGINKAMN